MCGEFCHVASFLSLPLKTEKILVVLGLSTQCAMCFSKPQGRPAEGPPRHGDCSSPTAKPDLDPREGAADPASQAHLASPAGGRNLAARAGKGRPWSPCDNHLASLDSLLSSTEGTSNSSKTSAKLLVHQTCAGCRADSCRPSSPAAAVGRARLPAHVTRRQRLGLREAKEPFTRSA